MASIDIYNIGYTQQFNVVGREELTKNLDLTTNTISTSGNLTGIVSSDGTGVSGATVKVYDVNDNPIEHTNTGSDGQYTIANLPVGSYKVTAIKDGYILPTTKAISIQSNKTTTADIDIDEDPNANLSVIYGIIRTLNGETPIENAVVSLYDDGQSEPELINTVTTNDKGQYIFAYVPAGEYYVAVSKAGYYPSQTAIIDVDSKELIDSDVTLTEDPLANTGTISGFIKDTSTGRPIEDASVALYSIVNGVESIVDTTRTNVTGMYLFSNVNPGTYLVKSTKQEEA